MRALIYFPFIPLTTLSMFLICSVLLFIVCLTIAPRLFISASRLTDAFEWGTESGYSARWSNENQQHGSQLPW